MLRRTGYLGHSESVSAHRIDWVKGICLNGPLEGQNLSTVNRIGCLVKVAVPRPGAVAVIDYEVVGLASNGDPARLSLVHQ
jgi:hypothetical protein